MAAPRCWQAGPDYLEVRVLAVPRAARSRLAGVHDDRLKLQLAAPPVDGAANEAVLELLAATCGLRRSAVTLRGGAASRRKLVRLSGDPEALARALEAALR